MKRKVYKIISVATCFVLVVAIVALCSIAYFNNDSDVSDQTFTFAKVKISEDTGFNSKKPSNVATTYDDDGYYLSIQEAVNNCEIPYAPKIKNEGEDNIMAYLSITIPYYVENGKAVSIFELPVDKIDTDKWCLCETRTVKENTVVTTDYVDRLYVYGYKTPLKPGEETPPLCTYIKTNAIKSPYNNNYFYPENGYVKAQILTNGVGIQESSNALSYIFDDPVYLNSTTYDNKMIKDTWHNILVGNGEQYNCCVYFKNSNKEFYEEMYKAG